MANYTIIGGDGREYGPVTGEDLRKWIAEERLNGESLMKGEGDAEFRPVSKFPEFADALKALAATEASPSSAAADWLERDYELDIGGCVTRGWDLYKENFGILFFTFLISIAVVFATSFALGLITMPINKGLMHAPVLFQIGFRYLLPLATSLVVGPLFGGLYFVYLKVIRQEGASVGDVFAGFQKAFGQLYLGALVPGLIVSACLLPFNFVIQSKIAPLLEQLQPGQTQHLAPADLQNVMHQLMLAYAGALPVFLICAIPMTYLTVNWAFTLPLIVDREMKFWPAMKASWKMVHKHWWQLFGLTVLVGLISLSGVLGCCIGALFTPSIGIAAMMFAYETIFSAEKK